MTDDDEHLNLNIPVFLKFSKEINEGWIDDDSYNDKSNKYYKYNKQYKLQITNIDKLINEYF